MKVLVTGGSGLVGRFLVEWIARRHEVEILDLVPPKHSDLKFHRMDLLDPEALGGAMAGVEAVVHLAGIPHPLNHPPETVFRTNTLTTFNVLEACAAGGVRKFVFMSSESTLGFAFSTSRLWPLYLPIDERHPLRPQDSYGMSKLSCEILCAGATAKTGIQTFCLRAPWIWCPSENEIRFYRTLVREFEKWHKNLWAWIHVDDVARAVVCCLETTLPPHDVFYVCAEDNWTGRESRMLVKEHYPETRNIDPAFGGTQSLISAKKAREVLQFIPERRVQDILGPEAITEGR